MSDSEDEGGAYGDDDEELPDSDEEEDPGSSVPAPTPSLEANITRIADPALRRNGALVEGKYLWSQTRDEAQVRFFVPAGTKAKEVDLRATKWTLILRVGSLTLADGRLCYPIRVEDEEGKAKGVDGMASAGDGALTDLSADWELKDPVDSPQGERLLCVTLRKLTPAPDVVIWWQGVMAGDPTVPPDQIQDRNTSAQTVFQQNWSAAHKQFSEKMSTHEPQLIDIGGDQDDGDGEEDGQGAAEMPNDEQAAGEAVWELQQEQQQMQVDDDV